MYGLERDLQEYIGDINFTWECADVPSVSIYHFLPTPEHPYHALVSNGVSKLINSYEGVELVLLLPQNWNMTATGQKQSKNSWPLHWIMKVAKYIDHTKKYPSFEDYISNEGMKPIDSSVGYSSVLLMPTVSFGKDFFEIHLPNKIVRFCSLIPLFPQEVQYLEQCQDKTNIDLLYERFDECLINEVVDIYREDQGDWLNSYPKSNIT